MRSGLPPENTTMEPNLSADNSTVTQVQRATPEIVEPMPAAADVRPAGNRSLVVVQNTRQDDVPVKKSNCARQRLEDQFRQTFLQQHPRSELATAARLGINEPTTVNGQARKRLGASMVIAPRGRDDRAVSARGCTATSAMRRVTRRRNRHDRAAV
ncbi:MAG: hypothetical protein MZV49_17310 [Rhodopseudomonas palustris]|nr:hypothetical protein [Rhodopseudomonas palustris]